MNVRRGGLPWRRLLTAALAAAAIFVFWSQLSDRGARDVLRGSAPADVRASAVTDQRAPAETRGWGPSVGFADQRRLDEHYQKHGAQFGRISKLDYLHQAQLLRDAKVGDPVLETVRRDGVVTRFDRQTGAFIAFNPNGVIRTFFKPNDGERYWRRQAERGE
jgi:pyocin large subunit-like protein